MVAEKKSSSLAPPHSLRALSRGPSLKEKKNEGGVKNKWKKREKKYEKLRELKNWRKNWQAEKIYEKMILLLFLLHQNNALNSTLPTTVPENTEIVTQTVVDIELISNDTELISGDLEAVQELQEFEEDIQNRNRWVCVFEAIFLRSFYDLYEKNDWNIFVSHYYRLEGYF